jgi:hypothetical protein
LRARIPYLDVAAEQMTVLRLFENYDAKAKAKVTAVPAMAFFGGLADLLVQRSFRGRFPLKRESRSRSGWIPGTRRRERA